VIWVAESIEYPGDGVVPNIGREAFERFVPVMMTVVPPPAGPVVGLIDVMVGGRTGETKVKKSSELVPDVPLGVVTVTLTVPVPAGLTTVIWVAETTTTLVPAVAPKSTAVAPVKLVPVRVTEVPPVERPLLGDTAVTLGTSVSPV
jgi:hypothetical protein